MNTKQAFAAEQSLLEKLEDEIVAGILAPGAHLAEVALAARFGVSRTPLRNALTILAERGWVRIVPNVGAFVVSITPADAAGLFLVRRELEGLAAELVCARWTAELARQMKDLADDYKRHRTAGRYYETRRANCRFHRAIIEASGCPALIDTITRARLIERSETARHPFEDQIGMTPADKAVTHYDMLKAFASGNPGKARAAAEQHIEQVRERLMALFISQPAAVAALSS